MKTTQQVPPNPTGKGGFGDNPHNRNPGGWKPEVTFSYQYKRFMNMPSAEFENWLAKNKDIMRVVEHLAYKRVLEAKKSLPDIREITDRTEGKAAQSVDLTSNGQTLSNLIAIPTKKLDNYDTDDMES